jgi:hypothetical protein
MLRPGIEGAVPGVSPIEDVGQLHPVGLHVDGPPTHEELQCLLFPLQDLVGATVGGLQSLARCVLTEEDMGALLKVGVHECSQPGRRGVWSELF